MIEAELVVEAAGLLWADTAVVAVVEWHTGLDGWRCKTVVLNELAESWRMDSAVLELVLMVWHSDMVSA